MKYLHVSLSHDHRGRNVTTDKEPTQPQLEMVHEQNLAIFRTTITGTPPAVVVERAVVKQGGTADDRSYTASWEKLGEQKPDAEKKAEEQKK